jgi:hypothetical protein
MGLGRRLVDASLEGDLESVAAFQNCQSLHSFALEDFALLRAERAHETPPDACEYSKVSHHEWHHRRRVCDPNLLLHPLTSDDSQENVGNKKEY